MRLDEGVGRPIDAASTGRGCPDEVRPDLVEYLVVVVPDQDALGDIVPAVAELVASSVVRILDVVALVRDPKGALSVLEIESVHSMAPLRDLDIEVGGMLSNHDIELAATALEPGSAALVLVAEDLWAGPLSAAARGAGGEIVVGDRIPPSRVRAVLSDRSRADPPDEDEEDGADQMRASDARG